MLAAMPKLVWDTHHVCFACLLSLSVYGLTSMIFNVSNQIVVRTLLRLGVGVPVPIFQDLRNTEYFGFSHELHRPSSHTTSVDACIGTGNNCEEMLDASCSASPEMRRESSDLSTSAGSDAPEKATLNGVSRRHVVPKEGS